MARVANFIVRTVTASYTVIATDELINANASSGNITITLPTVVGTKGREISIRKIDSSTGVVSVVSASGETVGNVTTLLLSSPHQSISVIADGLSSGDWFINAGVGYVPGDLFIKAGGLVIDQLAQGFVTANSVTIQSNHGLLITDLDGSYVLDSLPHIADGFQGQELTVHVHNGNGNKTLTFTDQGTLPDSGVMLGADTRVLGSGDTIKFVFLSDLESSPTTNWFEIAFNTAISGATS